MFYAFYVFAAAASVYIFRVDYAEKMFRFSRVLKQAEPLVKCEIQGKIAILKLNRPKAMNALNLEIVKEIAQNLQKCEADPNIGCVIITGEGIFLMCFCFVAKTADARH